RRRRGRTSPNPRGNPTTRTTKNRKHKLECIERNATKNTCRFSDVQNAIQEWLRSTKMHRNLRQISDNASSKAIFVEPF
ncbi:MAG: hypothetical protein Q6363_003700, partial [Candidatus Njordarchaeota archaeon]